MKQEIAINPLAIDDAGQAIDIMRQGVDSTIFPYLVHSCHGYAEYMKSFLRLPMESRDTFFFGAYNKQKLTGFSEWRRMGTVFFLSELFIAAEGRHLGIGKLLFDHGRTRARESNASVIEVDVFATNNEAREWYQRLGFLERYEVSWILGNTVSFQKPAFPEGYKIKNYSVAEACQKTYGFSMLEIESGSTSYSIGRLGDGYLRITSMENLYDSQLLLALRHLEPERRIMGIINNVGCCRPDNFNLITKSIRMHCPL